MSSRILVVDDTPANIQALAGILKAHGYQIPARGHQVEKLKTTGDGYMPVSIALATNPRAATLDRFYSTP